MSNIRVFVEWESSTVFAGEDVKCIITFKNVAPVYDGSRSTFSNPRPGGLGSGRERWISDLPVEPSNSSKSLSLAETEITPTYLPQYRSAHSLNRTSTRNLAQTTPSNIPSKSHTNANKEPHKHTRSVSIVSLRGTNTTGDEKSIGTHVSLSQQPVRSQGRAASFQGVTQRASIPTTGATRSSTRPNGSPSSSGNASRITSNTLSKTSAYTVEPTTSKDTASAQSSQSSTDTSLHDRVSARGPTHGAISPFANFRFPRDSSSSSSTEELSIPATGRNGKVSSTTAAVISTKSRENADLTNPPPPFARVISPVSIDGTPRSSVDLYSASNNSAETLASEYIAPITNRQLSRPLHRRQHSHLAPIASHSRPPEKLMMGYVQLIGSFALDGSLVSLAPFEEIKRKGVIGGQGSGGVVGVESTRANGSLFGALGWGNIGESLGGLLGGVEPSSIREMKGIASTRSVPILSSPQSILFVDLRLDPGESKSFEYAHMLPRGIPPTHKGRAMKVTYNLVIGTQRAQSKAQQHLVRHVDIPFRVLPGVNGLGDILGHDLMSPHIILQNKARTRSVDSRKETIAQVSSNNHLKRVDRFPKEFTSYIENLLAKPQQESTSGLLSPSEPAQGTGLDVSDETMSVKDIIEYLILRGNSLVPLKLSHSRFQIQRGGERVAVILLARPAYRLGETVSAIIDFQQASVQCHSLHISLESLEVVDPAIALRSSASIRRATRRVHGATSEVTVSTQRAVFVSTIPVSATPEFITSGVSLEWKLRFEFVTSVSKDQSETEGGVMEEVWEDDRGKILAAVEALSCESFDVVIPLRVYGALGASDAKTKVGGFPI